MKSMEFTIESLSRARAKAFKRISGPALELKGMNQMREAKKFGAEYEALMTGPEGSPPSGFTIADIVLATRAKVLEKQRSAGVTEYFSDEEAETEPVEEASSGGGGGVLTGWAVFYAFGAHAKDPYGSSNTSSLLLAQDDLCPERSIEVQANSGRSDAQEDCPPLRRPGHRIATRDSSRS